MIFKTMFLKDQQQHESVLRSSPHLQADSKREIYIFLDFEMTFVIFISNQSLYLAGY